MKNYYRASSLAKNIRDQLVKTKYKYYYLTEIEVCEGVKNIGDNAFDYSFNYSQGNVAIETAKKIVLPSGLVSIGASAFGDCDDLSDIYYNGTRDEWGKIELGKNWGNDQDVHYMKSENPNATPAPTADEDIILSGDGSATAEDHVEWRVEKNRENENLKLIISGTGKMKDYEAGLRKEISVQLQKNYKDCYIREIEVCEGVTSIGNNAFYNPELTGENDPIFDETLESVPLPEDTVVQIVLPEGLSTIGDDAFSGCNSLRKIEIPKSVTYIGKYAFSFCQGLRELNVPEGVSVVSASLFYNCDSLGILRLPATLTEIQPMTTGQDPVNCAPGFFTVPFNFGNAIEDIYYNGTKEDWNAIKKPARVGNYFHDYDDYDFFNEKRVTVHYLKSENPTATATPAPTAAVSEISGQIRGTALALKGKLGANVLLGFADAKTVEDADPSVVITVDGKETVLKLAEQNHYTTGKGEIYEISTFVPAKKVNDEIELKLIDRNGKAVDLRYGKKTQSTYTFSIGDIADSYLKNPKQYDTKTVDLVKAIRNYCGYAQLMTGYKTDTVKITDKLTKITAKDLKPYAVTATKGSKIAKYAGTALTLQSDTTMKVYFKLTDKADAYTVSVDGETVTPVESGENLYYVELASIPAGELSAESEIVISKGDETFTIKASALGWAESVLSHSKGQTQESIDMAKMLYRYAQKADAYFSKA
jgi:hypothetical protein